MEFHWDLIALTKRHYERALDEYISDIAPRPGVLAVYQFGQIGDPGVSDLDLLVVVSEDVTAETLEALTRAEAADELRRYVFLHSPLIIPETCAEEAWLVHSLKNLRLVWGRDVAVALPPERDRRPLMLADYVDFSFAVRTVLRSMAGGGSLRWLLILLRSCLHSLELAESIIGESSAPQAAEAVCRLRTAAADGDSEIVRRLSISSLDCVLDALRTADAMVDGYLRGRGGWHLAASSDCVSYADGRFYLFETPYVRSRNSRAAGVISNRWWSLTGVDPAVEAFPGFYLAQFRSYGRGDGPYSRAHRAIFGERTMFVPSLCRKLLRRRVEIVERIHTVLQRAGLTPMVPLGLGFRVPERIRPSRRRQLLRPIVALQARAGTPQ